MNFQGRLEIPSGLEVTVVASEQAGKSDVVASCEPVLMASYYQFEIENGPSLNRLDPSVVFTGLDPGQTLRMRVRAKVIPSPTYEDSLWSEYVEVTTAEVDPPEPPTPTDPDPLPAPVVSLRQMGLDRAVSSWAAVAKATGYEVELDGGTPSGQRETSKSFDGLASGQTITVRVRAYNAQVHMFSDWSVPKSVTIEGLEPPMSLEAQGVSENVIRVSFSTVPAAEAYDISYALTGGGAETLVDAPFTTLNVAGLRQATSYTFWVRSRADGATSGWSAPVTASTLRASKLIKVAKPHRVSYYPGDRHITARALNAEFNNILAWMEGGEVNLALGSVSPAPSPHPPLPAPFEPTIDVTPYDPDFVVDEPAPPTFPGDPPVGPPVSPDPPVDPGQPDPDPPPQPPDPPPQPPDPGLPPQPDGKLRTPRGLKVEQRPPGTNIKVTWEPVSPEPLWYYIRYTPLGSRGLREERAVAGMLNLAFFYGLMSGRTYEVRIKAVPDAADPYTESDWSDPVDIDIEFF